MTREWDEVREEAKRAAARIVIQQVMKYWLSRLFPSSGILLSRIPDDGQSPETQYFRVLYTTVRILQFRQVMSPPVEFSTPVTPKLLCNITIRENPSIILVRSSCRISTECILHDIQGATDSLPGGNSRIPTSQTA
jgi:hypothetical protein